MRCLPLQFGSMMARRIGLLAAVLALAGQITAGAAAAGADPPAADLLCHADAGPAGPTKSPIHHSIGPLAPELCLHAIMAAAPRLAPSRSVLDVFAVRQPSPARPPVRRLASAFPRGPPLTA